MYPECRHVHPTGAGCNAAALKNSHWCYFHHRFHERYRAQQARLRLHSQRDAAGRFTPEPSSSTALVPTSDYGTYPVADDHRSSAAPDVHVNTFAQAASLSLPPIEDSASVQLALVEVLEALAANQIDTKRAGLLLYGLQVAAANAKHVHLRSTSIQSVSYTADGIPLAPQEYGWDIEDIEEEIELENRESE
jgi:hypothetical protein